MSFYISDITTSRRYPATLLKESKCYYTVLAATLPCSEKLIAHRFHKATMYIDWQHLSLKRG